MPAPRNRKTQKKTSASVAATVNVTATANVNPSDCPPPPKPQPGLFDLLLPVICSAIPAFIYFVFTTTVWGAVRSTYIEQPLILVNHSFMGDTDRQSILECIRKSRLEFADDLGNPLSEGSFKGTRGYLLKFNKEGVEDFRSHKLFGCLSTYFDAIRDDKSNAWVMNLLICQESSGSSSSGFNKRKVDATGASLQNKTVDGYAVGLHVDSTLGIKAKRKFLSHQTNVYYVSVPPDMYGGQLELYEFYRAIPYVMIRRFIKMSPDNAVKPQENMMVQFRGDAFHQVKNYLSITKDLRISLVLEQYRVPEQFYDLTVRNFFQKRFNMTMM